jgi:hypothetical protein
VIDDDVLAFLRSRPIAMLCTRDRDNRPFAHETLLVEVEEHHVTGLVLEQFGRNLAENVADNGAAALVVSRAPGDHRSVQLKGTITALEPPRHRPELDAWRSLMVSVYRPYMDEAAAERFTLRVVGQPAFRLRLEVARVFNQTPGAGAGRPIGASA